MKRLAVCILAGLAIAGCGGSGSTGTVPTISVSSDHRQFPITPPGQKYKVHLGQRDAACTGANFASDDGRKFNTSDGTEIFLNKGTWTVTGNGTIVSAQAGAPTYEPCNTWTFTLSPAP